MANSAETVASQERWTKNMREDIDELADRTCKPVSYTHLDVYKRQRQERLRAHWR